MKMKLLRRNEEDPRLMADLARLAGQSEDETLMEAQPAGVVDSGAAPVASSDPVRRQLQASADTAPLADDAFVVSVTRAVVHAKRFLPFYGVAALWLLVILLINPVSSSGGGRAESAFDDGTFAATDADASFDDGPPPLDVSSPLNDSASGVLFPDFTSPSPSGSAPTFESSPATPSTQTTVGTAAPAPTTTPTTPPSRPLTIAEAGYASQSGGTALEREPANGGLPVASTGGNPAKISLLRLAGTQKVLRLKESAEAGANLNADRAAVKACPITQDGWVAKRGMPMSQAPTYSTACITGIRSAAGVWEWDLDVYGPARPAGFAFVPANDPSLNYQVTFEAKAVTN
ncbi:MAG: hypothetical protein ACR2H3_09295 [Acidimicrobiales bacterium]